MARMARSVELCGVYVTPHERLDPAFVGGVVIIIRGHVIIVVRWYVFGRLMLNGLSRDFSLRRVKCRCWRYFFTNIPPFAHLHFTLEM